MILIADAGNSKTDWVLVSSAGETLLSLRGQGISPYFDSESELSAKIAGAREKLGKPIPDKIFYYGSGCYRAEMKERVTMAIKQCFPKSKTDVADDLTAAGVALFGESLGLAVIAGTGSNAGISHQAKMTHRTVSLGYLLGDEGSGADIGFRFLKKLLSETLDAEICGNFYATNNTTQDKLIRRLYTKKRPQTFAASLVPFISSYRNDPEIRNIITASFEALLDVMITPLLTNYPGIPVGFAGSVASVFETELRETFTKRDIGISLILQDPIRRLIDYHTKY